MNTASSSVRPARYVDTIGAWRLSNFITWIHLTRTARLDMQRFGRLNIILSASCWSAATVTEKFTTARPGPNEKGVIMAELFDNGEVVLVVMTLRLSADEAARFVEGLFTLAYAARREPTDMAEAKMSRIVAAAEAFRMAFVRGQKAD
jgi:hypothetical protein